MTAVVDICKCMRINAHIHTSVSLCLHKAEYLFRFSVFLFLPNEGKDLQFSFYFCFLMLRSSFILPVNGHLPYCCIFVI